MSNNRLITTNKTQIKKGNTKSNDVSPTLTNDNRKDKKVVKKIS